jgi:phage terminase large subunit-like protein
LTTATATLNRNRAFIPHSPTHRQTLFLGLQNREAMFGGAAGGGKSDALLMAAAQYLHVPGYTALILRRTFVDLAMPDAIMDRAQRWWRGKANWNAQRKRFTFPSGASVTFGYLATDADVYGYQGAAFQYVAFDELTQFAEWQYRYLFSRLRRLEGSAVPVRMRSASNPGGIGHDWVRQRFLTEGLAHGRIFVPARLADNPYLDAAEYAQSLAELDSVTRAQLLNGDWTARNDGGYFKREWFPIIEERPAEVEGRERRWDFAATEASAKNRDPDWTVGALVSRTKAGLYHVEDIRRVRATPASVEALVLQTAQLDGRGVPIYIEQEPGSAGKQTIATYTRLLAGYDVHGERSTGPKEEYIKPFSAQCEAGNVRLVKGAWIGAFLDEARGVAAGGARRSTRRGEQGRGASDDQAALAPHRHLLNGAPAWRTPTSPPL